MRGNYFLEYNTEDSILVDIKNYQPKIPVKEKSKESTFINNFKEVQSKHLEDKTNFIEDNMSKPKEESKPINYVKTTETQPKKLNEFSKENIEVLRKQTKDKERQENSFTDKFLSVQNKLLYFQVPYATKATIPQGAREQLGLLGDYFSVTSKLRLAESQLGLLNNSNSKSNKKKRKSLKQMRQVPVTENDRERIENNVVTLEDKRKEIETKLRENYNSLDHWWERFGAGMATEVLRQYSDPRQWNSLGLLQFVGGPIGGSIASKLGITGGIAKKTFEIGSGAVGEMFEEAIDEYVTDKEVDPENVVYAGLASFLLGTGINVGKKVVGEIAGNFKGGDIVTRGSKYADNIQKNKGDISKTNKELAKSTIENLKPIMEALGKPDLEKEILKNSITINGKNFEEISSILKNTIELLISRTDNEFKTSDEIVELFKNDTDSFIKILGDLVVKEDITPEQKEMLSFLKTTLDIETLTDIDVDMAKFQEETSKAVENSKTPYNSNTQNETATKIDKKKKLREMSLKEKNTKIKHNKNDFPKDTLKQELIRDKVIPEGATIYYAKGYIDKKTGVAHIKAKWAENGEVFFTVLERKQTNYTKKDLVTTKNSKIEPAEQTVKNEEQTTKETPKEETKDEFDTIYETLKEKVDNPEKVEEIETKNQTKTEDEFDEIYNELKNEYEQKELINTKEEVVEKKAPENPIEETVGVIDEDFDKTSRALEVEKTLQREFELDMDSEILTNEMIKKINLGMIEKIGKIISEKTGLKNLDEIVNFYKNKYNIDIKVKEVESLASKGQERLGEITIIDLDTGKEFNIKIPKELSNEAKIGTFRHELQHVLDTVKDPSFESKAVEKVSKDKRTVLEVLKESQKGHFLDFENNWWEYSYILNYRINNLVTENGVNRESVKVLGLDIPEVLDENDIEVIKEISDSVKGIEELDKKLEWLKKKTSTYFAVKKAIKNYQTSRLSTGLALEQIKDALETLIILPFRKADEQAVSRMVKTFALEIDGNIINGERAVQMFYGTGVELKDFLFRGAELPEKLQEYSDVFNKLKTEWNTILDEMLEGTDVTKEDIINSAFYSEKKIMEDILGEKAKRFQDANGELDVEKVQKSEKSVTDPLTKKSISKALLDIREIFAEKFFKFFNTDLERLEVLLKNKELYGKEIAETLEGVKKCVTPEEFDEIIAKNNLEEIDEVVEFLTIEERKVLKKQTNLELNLEKLDSVISSEGATEKDIVKILRRLKNYMSPEEIINLAKEKGISELEEVSNLFKNEKFLAIKEIDYQKNIEDSRKRNAKLFFVGEAQSHKGNVEENKNIDSWLHKLSRFQWARDNGFITQEQLTNFIQENSVMENFGIQRLVKDLGAAYAIKNTLPGGGVNGLNRILKQIEDEVVSKENKTYTRNIQKYIKAEIGEKLGLVTKAPNTWLDRVLGRIIKTQNQASLAGRKAFFELVQEPLNIFGGSLLNYGGHGMFGIYKQLVKSILMNVFQGKKISEMDLATGKRWYNGVALETQNIIDDLDDFMGYKKIKLKQSGSKLAKLVNAFDTGMGKIKFYKYTQAWLNRASLFESGYILKKLTKYNSLEEMLSKQIKDGNLARDIKNIGITEKEFYFMKKIIETEAFKNYGVFSENDFFDIISDIELEEIFGNGEKLSKQELEILRESVVKKVSLFHDKIFSRVGPTESSGTSRYKIENEEDIVTRNVNRVKGNFTSSIQAMWGRMIKDFVYNNISSETGKFNASNGIYWKRLIRYALESGLTLGAIALLSNPDLYSDPEGVLEDTIDDILDEPSLALESYLSAQTNPWIVTSGSTVVERPLRFGKKVFRGEAGKASEEFLKLMFGTTNYNDAKFLYEVFEDNF